MQVPPERASTTHSVAIGGIPGAKPWLSAAKRYGASQAVMAASESMPGPKCELMVPPTRSSLLVGTNQDETPGPVAIACQTSSGVPGTSTSTCMDRRPDCSFRTLITAPLLGLCGGLAFVRKRVPDRQ